MQKRKTCFAALELCGAMIGAGFATGREVAAFFSRFGLWSWLGIAAGTGRLRYWGARWLPAVHGGAKKNWRSAFPARWGGCPRALFCCCFLPRAEL